MDRHVAGRGTFAVVSIASADSAPTLPTLKANEALRPAIEKCLRIQALRDLKDTSLVELMIQVDSPPVGMGFDVSMWIGDRKLFIGPMAWSKDISWWAYNVDVPDGR